MRYGVIFDLDDTLISTTPIYLRIYNEVCGQVIADALPDFVMPERMNTLFEMVKAGRVPYVGDYYGSCNTDWKLLTEEWPRIMADFYVACMLDAGRTPSEEKVLEAYNRGLKIFHSKYHIVDGANQITYSLFRRTNVDLFIVTHGSPALQERKVKGEKMFDRFREVIMTPITESKQATFEDLRNRYPEIEAWIVVGDSIVRDINPALACGMYGFHVKRLMQADRENGKVMWLPDGDNRFKEFLDLQQLHEFMRDGLVREV